MLYESPLKETLQISTNPDRSFHFDLIPKQQHPSIHPWRPSGCASPDRPRCLSLPALPPPEATLRRSTMRRRSPPPAAAQPPRPPTRAAESGEAGGDPGKDEVAAPPKGDSALPRSGSGFGSGNAAAPDGPAKSPMKPKKRVTAPPSSDHGSRENLAAGSPSNEVPAPQGDDAAQEDDLPESPPKSKKNRKKKKKALRAGDSGKVAAPDDPAEPTRPQQDVGGGGRPLGRV